MQVMKPGHPEWAAFVCLLAGKKGCNFRYEKNGSPHWKCRAKTDKRFTEEILKRFFPLVSIPKTIAFLEANGGYCDCEILWNIAWK